MRSAITVSLVPEVRGGPFVFCDGLADGCRQAAELGFDAVEVFPRSPAELNLPELRAELQRHSLQLAAMGTGAGWVVHQLRLTDPDAAVRAKAIDFVGQIVRIAGEFGAPAIIGSMQGRYEKNQPREEALRLLGDALLTLSRIAESAGTSLLIEPLNRYETNLLTSVIDSADWVRTLSAPPVKLLCDLFHMNIEEADLANSLRAAGPLVGHVHFADSNRRAIGQGHTQIPPVIAALQEIGYAGYLSAEIFPLPDANAAARQTIDSFRRFAR